MPAPSTAAATSSLRSARPSTPRRAFRCTTEQHVDVGAHVVDRPLGALGAYEAVVLVQADGGQELVVGLEEELAAAELVEAGDARAQELVADAPALVAFGHRHLRQLVAPARVADEGDRAHDLGVALGQK